jgi:uncharacterized membrane protein YGL010W
MFKGIISNEHGYFNWEKRYAIHQAFHQTTANKFTHFLSTPIQLFAMIKLFALCSFPFFFGVSLNVGLFLILFLSIVYCLIHFKMGLVVSLYLIICWYVANYYPLFTNGYLEALFALAIFLLGAFIQIGVGHKIFERKNANLSSEFEEFFQTYNPMIFILIFFFPFLDLLNANSE